MQIIKLLTTSEINDFIIFKKGDLITCEHIQLDGREGIEKCIHWKRDLAELDIVFNREISEKLYNYIKDSNFVEVTQSGNSLFCNSAFAVQF
jgi:hypothetical protein